MGQSLGGDSSEVLTATAHAGARILIVDDNADMREYLTRLLVQRFRVESVADGRQALTAIERERPALVLSDVMMPNLDGFGLLRALRGDASTATVPASAIAVFVGHCWPLFHGFKGGKGVATGAGIVFALHWPLGLALTAVWLVMAFGFKISSLAALAAATLMPLGMFYVRGNDPVAWAMVPIALLLAWRHQANIRGLLQGRERTIGR